ncbi:MAG: helix-turn-helix transcriptional regulator [Deinococcota bacterium]
MLVTERVATKLNNQLKTLRRDKGWTQGDLAERLDVSRQTVNAIENGRYDPSLPLAFTLADVFDCHIEDIFFVEGTQQHAHTQDAQTKEADDA